MEEIFEILDFICQECDATSLSITNPKENNIKLFCVSLLDRINLSSFSLKILLENFANKNNQDNLKKYEYSAAIIIRSVMLDYIILIKTIEILYEELIPQNKKFEDLNIYCGQRLADSMIRTIRDNKKIYDLISEEERKKFYPNGLNEWNKNFIKILPEFFETENINYSDNPQLKEKYKDEKFNSLTIINLVKVKFPESEVIKVYEFYLYYSKYDHFGYTSFFIQKELDYNYRIEKLKKAICLFIQFYQYVVFILLQTENNSTFLEHQLNKTKIFMSKLSCFQP